MDFLNFFSNTQTLEQLLKKNKQNQLKKIAKHETLPRTSGTQESNLIDVKQPFYIDRFNQFYHKDCHLQGKCLACQYAKLKAFELKKMNPFLHSRHNNYNNIGVNESPNLRMKTQRQSYDSFVGIANNMRRYRASEGTQNIDSSDIIKNIKLKLKYLSKSNMRDFYEKKGKNVNDPQMLEYIYKYLLNKTWQNETFLEKFSKIRNLNMKDLLSQQQFLKDLPTKQEIKNSKTNSTATPEQNTKTSTAKEIPEKLTQKQRKQSIKIERKKVLFEEQAKLKISKTRTSQICSEFLTGNEKQLSKQMRQILKNLANQKYNIFKQIIGSLDENLHQKYNQDPTCHEKMKKKLELIVDWLKMHISPKDNNEDLKKYQINKLIQSLQNLSKPNRRKSSLKYLPANTKPAGLSRFNSEDHKQSLNQTKNKVNIVNIEKGKNKISFRNQKSVIFNKEVKEVKEIKEVKEDGVQNIETNKKLITDQTCNKTNKTATQGTAKLIEEEMRDLMECEQLEAFSKKASNKKSDIVQLNKISYLKHQKSKQYEIEERQFHGRSKNKQSTRKNIESIHLDKKKKSKIYVNQTASLTSIRLPLKAYIDAIDMQRQSVQSDKRTKIFLKIKAAQLLRLNQELIQKVKKHLREQNLSEFVINSTDCVLTRKKKIRILREMINSQLLTLKADAIGQILEYLQINQESYRILIGKRYYQTVMNENEGVFDWDMLDRKQPLSKLLFYDLNNEFIYGNADEDEINYLYNQVKKDRSWEISSKNINADPILEKNQNQKKKKKLLKDQSGVLIQKEMSEACLTKF